MQKFENIVRQGFVHGHLYLGRFLKNILLKTFYDILDLDFRYLDIIGIIED